ncbi:MAG: hypothetical protein AUK35_08450 [Zetaproteobacteria bacterium CG2_30_46_52]|nr:MAG: hypothetical protein AUK35_08450 [Zetaproteobacteria bacterium CG2_30_46_52]
MKSEGGVRLTADFIKSLMFMLFAVLVLSIPNGYAANVWSDNALTRTYNATTFFTGSNVNKFVAVGNSGAVATSADGITWNEILSGLATLHFNSVASNGTKLVAVGIGGVATSTDGVTWTQQTTPAAVTPADASFLVLNEVIWNGLQFIAVGSRNVVQYNLGTYVATIITSPDGVTWTSRTPQLSNTVGTGWTYNLHAVAASGTEIVAVGIFNHPTSGESGYVEWSTDGGVTWSGSQLSPVMGGGLQGIAWGGIGGSKYVAVGREGTILSSPNGQNTWTAQSAGLTVNDWMYDVAVQRDGSFIVSGDFDNNVNASTLSPILTSNDGVMWVAEASNTTQKIVNLGAQLNTVVAVGPASSILSGLQDVFPSDPAATVDYDMDGLPDAWNPNASPAQIAASSLVLDPRPGNFSMQNSLLVRSPLDGNVNDASGNNLNGTNTNGIAIADRKGNVDSALNFSAASTAFARIDNIPASKDFTVALWARSKSAAWNQLGIIASSRMANGFIMHSDQGTTGWTGGVADQAGAFQNVPQAVLADIDATWHHYAMTYDSYTNTARMFNDGVQVSANSVMTSVRSDTGVISVDLGRDFNALLNRYGDVELDEFRIYNKALSQAEVFAFGALDIQAPVMTLNGASAITIAHGGSFVDPGVTVTDNLDTGLLAKASNTVNVNAVGTYTVTYTVSDSEGNAATPITRTVHVTDQTPPTVTLNGANPDVWYLHTDYVDSGVTASDNVSGSSPRPPIYLNKIGTVDVTTPGEYTITYTLTDSAGNSTVISRTVIVADTDSDGVPDGFDAFPNDVAASVDYDMDGLPDAWNTGKTAADSTTGLVLDLRPGNPAMQNSLLAHFSLDGNLNDSKENSITAINYGGVATSDRMGNTNGAMSFPSLAYATIDQVPTTKDFTVSVWAKSPQSTWNASRNIILDNSGYGFGIYAQQGTTSLTANIYDVYAPTAIGQVTMTDIYSSWHHFAITYDSYSNTGRMFTDGVEVMSNNAMTLPDRPAAFNMYVYLGGWDGALDVDIDDLRFYNKALTQSEIISFGVIDSTAPVMTLNGNNPMTIAHGSIFTDPGVTITDIDPLVATVTGTVDIYTVGTYTLTYSVTDTSGNIAAPVTRTVHVTDQTAPVISLNGSSSITLVQGDNFLDLGTSVTDNVDVGLTSTVTYQADTGLGFMPASSVDVNVPGVYTITDTVSDAAGNAATPVTRTVTVVADLQVPVININGANPLTVPQGVAFADPGTTVVDNSATVLYATGSNTLDVNTVGTYTITYTVSDRAGNAATPVTRTVHVTDQTAPVITLNGQATMNVPKGVVFTDPGVLITENVDTGLVATVTGSVNINAVGTYTITYDVSDSAGNVATTVTRTVHVVFDQTPPVIQLNTVSGQITVSVPLGGSFSDPGSTVTDNVDTGLVATVTGTVDVNTPGVYVLYYDVTDRSGNKAAQVRRHVLVDRGTNPKGLSWYMSGYYDVNHPNIEKLAKNPTSGVIIGVGKTAFGVADQIYSTSNGSTWTLSSFANASSSFSDVIWAGSQFVAVGAAPDGSMSVAKSLNDGTSWSYFYDATKSARTAVGYISQGTYVGSLQAVGPFTNGNDIYYSSDNVTWLAGTSLDTYSANVNVNYRGMIASNSWPVAYGSIGGDATDSVWVGNGDGIFFDQSYVLSSTGQIRDMVGKDGTTTVVAVGSQGLVMTNTNYGAGNWTEMTLPDPTISLNAVTWTGSEFVAVSDNQLFASVDGVIWQKTMDFHGMNPTDIISGTNNLIIVGYSNLVVSGLNNDTDGDGVKDLHDAFPGDPAASSDIDFDGHPDAWNANATIQQISASALTLDAFPNDPAVSVDYDMDGQPDAWNAGATVAQIEVSSLSLDPLPGNAAMQSSLLVRYNLDGNINDAMVNHINGVNTNGVAIADRMGNAGGAMSFSADTYAFARIDNIPASTDFTATLWARSTSPTWNQLGILASSRVANGFIMHTEGGTSWTGYVYDNTGAGLDSAPTYAQADIYSAWHHYALSYNSVGKSTRMYVDGVQVSIRPLTNVVRNSTGTISVELAKDFGLDRYGNVELDDFRIYNKELSWSEVFAFGAGDYHAPVIALTGANPLTVAQGSSFVDPGSTVTDDVDTGLVATASGTLDMYTVGTYTLTYNASDAGGNAAAPVLRTVIVTDQTAPVISLNGANPMYVALGSSFVDPGHLVADNVDSRLTEATVTGTVDTNTLNTYTLTYNVSDAAGNAATTVTRTVIVSDQTAPVISLNGANPMTVAHGSTFADPGSSVTDNVDTGLVATVNGTVNTSALGSNTLSYNVSDTAGNVATTVTRTVNVIDQTAPDITVNGSNPVDVQSNATYVDAYATVTDNIDATIATLVGVSNVNTSVAGTYTVTYNYTDTAGNAAATVTRTVNVIADTIAPVITLNGASTISLLTGTAFTDPGTTVTDNVDTGLTATVTGTVDIYTAATYTLTYNVSDAAGNAATPVTRTVIIEDDSDGDGVLDYLDAFPLDPAASVDYDLDGKPDAWNVGATQQQINASTLTLDTLPGNAAMLSALMVHYPLDGSINDTSGNNIHGVNTNAVATADRHGNLVGAMSFTAANSTYARIDNIPASQNFTLSIWARSTAQTWNQNGVMVSSRMANGFAISPIAGTKSAQLTLYDLGGNKWDNIQYSAFNVSNWHHYTLAYDFATDAVATYVDGVLIQSNANFNSNRNSNGTISLELGRDFGLPNYGDIELDDLRIYNKMLTASEVRAYGGDDVAPVITYSGANPLYVAQNSQPVNLYPQVTDMIDTSVWQSVQTGTVDTATPGTYTLTFTATDASGNTATLDVTVIVTDNTRPVITLNGLQSMTAPQNAVFTDPGVVVTDNVDSGLTATVTGSVDTTAAIGSYFTLYYNATDAAGNQAYQVWRSVQITDGTPPTVTLNGTNPITLVQGATFSDPGATAVDDYNGNNPTVTVSGTVNTAVVGSYILTYSATDTAGNTGAATRIVDVVADTVAPNINIYQSNPFTVVQHAVFTAPSSGVSDNASSGLTATVTGAIDTSIQGTYLLTYSATDAAGNTGTTILTVNVVADTSPPVINSIIGGNPLNVAQGSVFTDPGVSARDNSGRVPTVTTAGTVDTATLGSYTLTYTATDMSGNSSSSVTRSVEVVSFASEVFPSAGNQPAGWAQSAGADYGWVVSGDNAYDGYASLRSDPAMYGMDNYTAAVEITIDTNAGNVIFAYDVDSEDYSDVLNFYIDGAQQNLTANGPPFASGQNQPWTLFNIAVIAGVHTFKWEYTKDGGATNGEDAAWIDAVMLPPAVGLNDTTAPMIDLYGSTTMTAVQNGTFTDPGVRILDNVDNGLTATVTGTVDMTTVGTYTLTYTATDAAGNSSRSLTRTVSVVSMASEVFPPAGLIPSGWGQSAGTPYATSNGANVGYSWLLDTTSASAGIASLSSDPAMYNMDDSSAAIEVSSTVSAGNITFDYLVDSEQGYDFIHFYIDDVQMLEDSGIGNAWTSVSYAVSAGTHTFKWEYVKDGSALDGMDAAWIDNVVLPPVVHPPVIGADAITVTQNQSVIFTAASLLANDTDVDGDTISLVGLGQPAHGTLVDDGNGSYTYTPNADYTGTDSIPQTITDGGLVDVYQWASSATASTEYDVAPNGWSASQVIGAPNVAAYGDERNAWTPSNTGSPEWLQVGYNTYVHATGITVYETYTNGYINKVELIDSTDVAHVVWTGTDTTQDGVIGEFVLNFPETTYLVKAVKISFSAAPNWMEIDAVQLRGRGQSGFTVQGNVNVDVLSAIDTTAPVVSAPANVTVSATGVLTPVTLGVGRATDNVDGAVTATPLFAGPFMQGTHSITWRATDAAGNVGSAVQTVIITAAATDALTLDQGATLPIGSKQTLQVKATKSDGTVSNVRLFSAWSSSNPTIATVNGSGVVVARAVGTTTISATYDGLTSTTTVTVTNPTLTGITLLPQTTTMKIGELINASAQATFSDSSVVDARAPATWTSSNSAIASVGGWGRITAIAAGTTTITADWQGVSASITVTVSPATLTSVLVSGAASMSMDQTLQMQATGVYSDTTVANVKNLAAWSSSDPTIATVNSKGLVTSFTSGTVDIYATFNGVSGFATLTVDAATLSALQLSPGISDMAVGDVQKFSVTGLMSDGSKYAYRAQDVVWSSSNPAIATVDDSGWATAVAQGSVDIYASLSSGEQASAALTVNANTLTGLQFHASTQALPVGQDYVYRVTGTYSDGSSGVLNAKQVGWSSSDPTVLSIKGSGLATGQAAGTATVTATVGGQTVSTVVTVSGTSLVSMQMKLTRTSYPQGVEQTFRVDGTFSDRSVLRLRPGDVVWSTSDAAVVQIDPRSGKATMVAAGSAIITATEANGAMSVQANITVSNATLSSLLLRPNTTTLTMGDTLKYWATGVFSDGIRIWNIGKDAVWSSSDSAVVSVNAADGIVTAIGAGSATLTATMPGGITGTLTITVN